MNKRKGKDVKRENRNVLGSPAPAGLPPGAPRGGWALVLAPHCPLSVPSWHTVIVNGHSVEELCKAFSQAKHQPTAIIAKTFKGRGISGPYARVSLLPPLGMGPVAERVGVSTKGGISLRSPVWGGCSSECTLAGDSVVSMAELGFKSRPGWPWLRACVGRKRGGTGRAYG